MIDVAFWFKLLLVWNVCLTILGILNYRLHSLNKDLWFWHYLQEHGINFLEEIEKLNDDQNNGGRDE